MTLALIVLTIAIAGGIGVGWLIATACHRKAEQYLAAYYERLPPDA
jgi:hypothetical protein